MISLRFTFPALAKRITGRLDEVDLFVAAQLQTNRGLLFDSEGKRNGGKEWPKPKFRNGQTGAVRGTLRKSIAPQAADGKPGQGGYVKLRRGLVTIGTRLAYAAMFNFGTKGLPGGVLRPKKGTVLRIPLPAGKMATEAAKTAPGRRREQKKYGKGTENVIYRRWVRIPEHRFDILTPADEKEIARALKNKLAELLRAQKK